MALLGMCGLEYLAKKNPYWNYQCFTNDEAALLILSILNEKQIHVLEEVRNLDFSYSFKYINYFYSDKTSENVELRLRGDAFFDVDCLAMNMRSIIPELRTH